MSKKFTSLLVLAAAALLLTVPTHAQLTKKAAKHNTELKAGPLKVNDVQKVIAAKEKATATFEGQAFTGAMHQQVATEATLLKAAINKIESDKAAFEKQMEDNLKGARQLANSVSYGMPRLVSFTSTQSNNSRRAEAVDEHGIITAPAEGELKYYTREGYAYYYNSGWKVTSQGGHAEVIECADGTVYFKNPVSRLTYGSYIKGTKNGNTITVPAGQPILYDASYDATIDVKKGAFVSGTGFVPNEEQSDIVFTVNGNTLTLEGTSSSTYEVLGGFWSDDNSMQSGDAETILTYDPEYTPASTDPIVAPAGLVTETWNTKIDGVVSTATIGFDNNDVYVKGLFADYPDAWIKGTIDGATVTFAKLQFVGTYQSYNIWASGVDQVNNKLADFVMTYDAAAKTLTGSDLLLNAADDKIYYLSWFEDVAIQEASFVEPTAQTGANVDAVPYSNALNTEDLFAEFGVLDSNNDGSTWAFDASYGAYYRWNSANNGNDWLISPAIKLEAGKKYHFAIDAKSAGSGFPERFEVLIGTEAKASALTQSVIPATEVGSTDYVTYENDAVAVAETGYYHFGIHAISDADMFRLMVANFLVEAGVEATAPAAVTDLAVAQTPEKLEAVVSFKAPTKTVGGADLTDLTKIDVLRDGKVIKSLGGAEPISWDASAQGYENAQDVAAIDFGGGFTATLDGGGNTNTPKYYTSGTALRMYAKNSMTLKGTAIKKVVFTFKDKNVLEANVGTLAIDGMTGTWTGNADEIVFTVTDGSGNQARIQKIEIEGAAAGLTPGAEYSYVDAEDLTVGTHVYQVIPYNTSGVGVKSEEKSIFISVSLEAPYTFDFSQNLLDLFNVIDNNEDGKTWLWSSSNGAYYPYHGTNAADDYLITLPFNLKAGKRYNVIVNAKGSASYPERFEVKAGKEATVAGLTEQVIAPTDLNTGEFDDYEGVFAPEEDGLYYFAIHAISDADMLNLQVKTLAIELAPELTAPAAVADLTATPGAEGALEATLAFTAPSKDIKGDALTGNVDVKIYRDNELVNTLEGVAAGAAASWKDTEVENGTTYTYYVVAANESGDGLKSEKVKVFVGEDAFGTVENIQITGSTASTISFSWDPVTGANGGYVNAAAAKYAIVSTHVETVLFWQVLVIDEILATVTGETSATVNYDVNAGDQGYKYFGVLAYKEDTELPAAGDEYAGGYTYALVGAPYELPMFESFTDKTMHYLWDSNAQLIVDEVSSDDDGVAVDLLADEAGIVTFESGKININGTANPTLLFNAKSPNISKLYVYASKNGGEMSPVAELDLTEDYQTFKVSLANLANNANYVQFALVAQYTTPYTVDDEGNLVDLGDYYTLDEIRVMDLFEYNLVADIKAPKSVVAGQKAKVVATVTNYGENAAKDYTVTVKAGENVLTTVIGSDELAPFAKDEIEVEYETSIFDEAGDVTLTVDVDYENELNPDDNTASTIITVKEPTAGAPASLAAVDKGAEGVELTWAMPAASRAADAVTEDFEDTDVFEPFSLGGITAENHNGAFGDWKLYDGNGITVYGFNGLQFPNNYQPAAWQVFTTVGDGAAFADNYPANSGDQYLISFCPAEENNTPAADHWLISPELSGAAQTISFFARIITAQYGPETFEVWASTTDDNVESFTKVADYSTEAVEWTEFTADLPAGAKYFAIRHTSVDIFGLLIDDVTFAAAGATAPVPTSFNIYFEKDKVASVEGDKTTYTVAVDKLTAGEHTFAVTAVYATGAESKPVTATVTVTTDIRQIAADGKAVDIYSVDGKLVRSQATSLDGLKGLYIVDGKKIMVK